MNTLKVLGLSLLAVLASLSQVEARPPRTHVHITNELPGTLQTKVGHRWLGDAKLTLLKHESGILYLDQGETHIVHRTLFMEDGRELRDDYPIRIPNGVTEMSLTFGGLQIGVIYNRSGKMAWVMPPTHEATGFYIRNNGNGASEDTLALSRQMKILRTWLQGRVRDFIGSNFPEYEMLPDFSNTLLESATTNPARLDSLVSGLLKLGVDATMVDSLYAKARVYTYAKEVATLKPAGKGKFTRPNELGKLRYHVLSDSLFAQGIPLQNGEAYAFAIQTPSQTFGVADPTFVIFFGEERERRLELKITGINEVREDQEFGGVWVDWRKNINPHHYDQSRMPRD